MTLGALLAEIGQAGRPLTPAELGRRLGVEPGRIDGMLGALRAQGRLVADHGTGSADVCGGAGMCRGSCPGPANCALVADPGVTPLQLVIGWPDRVEASSSSG